jgi:3-oxoadipate enol-lactonase
MFAKTEDHLNLYYEVQGNLEAKETLVFLNGLTQSTLSWFFVIPYFKAKYKLILLDFIFQGQSDKTGEWRNFDKHAKDVVRVLDQEKVQKAIIIGLSYGSLVAQHFAVQHSERVDKLVLLSTFAHKTPYYEAIELSWWRALELGGYSLLLDIMLPSVLSENYFKTPIIPIDMMKASRKEVNANAEAIFKLMRATKEREDYRPSLKKINVPTLVIQGEKDLLLPVHLAQAVHDAIPGSKFHVLMGAGHTLNLEKVEEVCKYVSEFLFKS